MRTLAIALALVAGATGVALAQSKKYPPTPVDKDLEAQRKSRLWDRATNPQRTPYEGLWEDAVELLKQKSVDAALEAAKKLDQAIVLLPKEPKAYIVRGDAWTVASEWAKCAADYASAVQVAKQDDLTSKETADVRRKLGICQARAGKLADAERTLAEATASGMDSGEVWMRLGEVRIAMGKLEEAIAALEAASEAPDNPSPALIRWLLAGAYDRALRPAESAEAARRALAMDRFATMLESPPTPFLGQGEQHYLRGIAYAAFDPPRPEYVLLYFRQFLKAAPESPWRRRAEEHLRELKAAQLPEAVVRIGGNAALDLNAAMLAVRRAMPAMRQCLAKTPGLALKVEVTRVGPRTPQTPGARGSRIFAPPEGVAVTSDLNLDAVATAEKDAAIRCVDPIAEKIQLPVIADKDAYYKAFFYVVGP
ncbi:MAG: tetratricopeptide repeat protein [Deltaproteobacteria bacterium]|nr:tetratricopeptide repeat protein [Deltaproteobacteria bacterium]